MSKILKFMFAIMLLSLAGVASAQTPVVEPPSIEAHLMTYIDAINMHDYATAYSMWQSPIQTYEDFVAGFAETQRIVPYFGRVGVGSGSAYVTTVLLGYQTDGTVESYYGYFRLANGGNYSPPIDGWVMTGSTFQLLRDGIAMHNSTMQSLLSQEWVEHPDVVSLSSLSEMSDSPATTLLGYYDLINAKNFATAYPQWLSPYTHGLTTDYRLPYTQFANGYADTDYVTVYAGSFQEVPASQYRSYLRFYVPVVLIGQHTDGTFVTYSGCYALGQLTSTTLGIVNGRFTLVQDDVANADTIFNTLNTLYCAGLGMGI